MRVIAELFGGVAIITTTLIYQQTSRKKLLLFKAMTDFFMTLHYVLIGAFSGAVVTGIAFVRELVFFNTSSKDKHNKIKLILFMFVSIVCSVLTWKNMFSLLTMVASIIAIVSFWIGKPKLSRKLAFPVSTCFIIYGLSNRSITATLNECIALISTIIGVIRHDLQKGEEQSA